MFDLRKSMQLLRLAPGLFVFAAVAGHAKSLTVGQPNTPCPNPNYSTITQAINSAAPGDEIDICPALYAEQLVITKPLTLNGISVNNVNRILIQPTVLTPVAGYEAVITVMNTHDVVIRNLALDAGNNSVTGCSPTLSVVQFLNASGSLQEDAISGAQLSNPSSCGGLIGNGFGVLVNTDGSQAGPFQVSMQLNSVHDVSRHGIYAVGAGIVVDVENNSISGIGPTTGVNQFGVFLSTGAGGRVSGNMINEGTCGALPFSTCFSLRSEGVTLRAVADGTIVDGNVITNAQSGIFINGGSNARISNNVIRNIDALDGIDIQGTASGFFTDSLIQGNAIYKAVPVANESCGIYESSGTGVARNRIVNNLVNDAYCGIAYVAADSVEASTFFNTLYNTLNTDLYPSAGPPPVEP
jgi:Right handed beta helix region